MNKIPDKERLEWKKLILGELKVPLKNFFFQMKVTQLRSLLKKNEITLEDAVNDIYNLCLKFSNAKNMSSDIEAIFGSDIVIETTSNITEPTTNTVKNVEETQKNSFSEPSDDLIIEEESETSNKADLNNDFETKLQERMKEILKQKQEMEEKINKLIKAREEAEKKAKLEKKKRLLELERMNMKKEIYKPKEIIFEKKAKSNKNSVSEKSSEAPILIKNESKQKEIERQKKLKKVRTKKKVDNRNFIQRWFNL